MPFVSSDRHAGQPLYVRQGDTADRRQGRVVRRATAGAPATTGAAPPINRLENAFGTTRQPGNTALQPTAAPTGMTRDAAPKNPAEVAANAAPAAPAPAPTAGTASGPGILEQWFNMRASGTDPAYEYALKRGTRDINNEFAARGGFNSGGAMQRIGDFEANMAAQRMGQLDSLAGGASGEHQGRLNSMFSQGLGLAGGQAGLSSGYDLGAANAMNQNSLAAIQLGLDKAGVDPKMRQQILDSLFGLGSLAVTA